MAKRSKRSAGHIPFAVFVLLLLAIVGFHLQKQRGDNVLGEMTSSAPLFSREWFADILSFFGLGTKTERTPVQYALPTYSAGTKNSGFSTTGNTESDALLVELESTSDDGGQGEFDSLEAEASDL